MITQTYISILKMVKFLYVWGLGLYDYHRVLYVIWAENAKQNLNLAIWAEFKKWNFDIVLQATKLAPFFWYVCLLFIVSYPFMLVSILIDTVMQDLILGHVNIPAVGIQFKWLLRGKKRDLPGDSISGAGNFFIIINSCLFYINMP